MKLKPSFQTTTAFGIMILAMLACNYGTPKPPDPCDEAFQALTAAFTATRPGVIGNDAINVWPANPDGSASHPRVEWGAKSNASWREVASFMRFNCGDQYEVKSLSKNPDEDEGFYDDGVIVRRKPAQSSSLTHSLSKELPDGVMTTITAIIAFLGIRALGLGAKKAFA